MNPDEKTHGCDSNPLVSRFQEDLRICREALLEAKQRIIILEQRLRVFLTCLIILVGGTMAYATIQIWQTSVWLQDHTHYIRDVRDPKWEKWMNDLRQDQDIIKSRVDKMQIH